MRVIHLLQNTKLDWFVRVTSGGDIISPTESYDTPAGGVRAFISEGRNQPYAKMVVHPPGGGKSITVRKARPFPKGDDGAVVDVARVRAAVKPVT